LEGPDFLHEFIFCAHTGTFSRRIRGVKRAEHYRSDCV
jgi:hypothetical protein